MNIEKSTVWAYQQMFDGIDLDEKDLLDVGGGKAIAGFLYGKSLRRYVCIDTYEGRGNPSENFQIIQNRMKNENSINMEIKRMNLEKFCKHHTGQTFDIVLISNVLHHIFPRPTAMEKVVNYLDIVSKALKPPYGLLVIRESMPINISQLIPSLNKDNVNFATKFFPGFWIEALRQTHCFDGIRCIYHIPYKLRSLYPLTKNLQYAKFISSIISTSSYVIRAQRR